MSGDVGSRTNPMRIAAWIVFTLVALYAVLMFLQDAWFARQALQREAQSQRDAGTR